MEKELNWNDLQYFVHLVDAQTLTATADKLDVQHTTVARRIEQLESALSIKLFDRMGKRYTLTEEGQLLYTQACEVASSIHTLKQMADNQHALQGNVVVSAPPVLANELLVTKLNAFYHTYPEICLSLQGEVHHTNLYQREADIALRIGRPTQDNLVIRKLTDVRYAFYAHLNLLPKLANPESSLPLIEFRANPKLLAWSNQLQQIKNVNVVFATNDMYVAKNAIAQGLGIGILAEFVGKSNGLVAINPNTGRELREGEKVEPNPNLIPAMRSHELYLVMHPDVRRSPRVRAVADWLIAIFEAL